MSTPKQIAANRGRGVAGEVERLDRNAAGALELARGMVSLGHVVIVALLFPP